MIVSVNSSTKTYWAGVRKRAEDLVSPDFSFGVSAVGSACATPETIGMGKSDAPRIVAEFFSH
jgi:hypothetical protein